MNLAMQHIIANFINKQTANYIKLNKKFEFMQLIIEDLISLTLAALLNPNSFQHQLSFLGSDFVLE